MADDETVDLAADPGADAEEAPDQGASVVSAPGVDENPYAHPEGGYVVGGHRYANEFEALKALEHAQRHISSTRPAQEPAGDGPAQEEFDATALIPPTADRDTAERAYAWAARSPAEAAQWAVMSQHDERVGQDLAQQLFEYWQAQPGQGYAATRWLANWEAQIARAQWEQDLAEREQQYRPALEDLQKRTFQNAEVIARQMRPDLTAEALRDMLSEGGFAQQHRYLFYDVDMNDPQALAGRFVQAHVMQLHAKNQWQTPDLPSEADELAGQQTQRQRARTERPSANGARADEGEYVKSIRESIRDPRIRVT